MLYQKGKRKITNSKNFIPAIYFIKNMCYDIKQKKYHRTNDWMIAADEKVMSNEEKESYAI